LTLLQINVENSFHLVLWWTPHN